MHQYQLGPDEITVGETSLLVRSPVDMADWEVREFRRVLVTFREKRYYVASKEASSRHFEYVLKPWLDSMGLPGHQIIYDAHYVAGRTRALRRDLRRRISEPIALAAHPLLGFLNARAKQLLERESGLDVYSATRASLLLEFFLLVIMAVFLLISMWVGAFGSAIFSPSHLMMGMAILVPDLIIRWDYAQKDGPYLGFYEWPIYWLKKTFFRDR